MSLEVMIPTTVKPGLLSSRGATTGRRLTLWLIIIAATSESVASSSTYIDSDVIASDTCKKASGSSIALFHRTTIPHKRTRDNIHFLQLSSASAIGDLASSARDVFAAYGRPPVDTEPSLSKQCLVEKEHPSNGQLQSSPLRTAQRLEALSSLTSP
eukprot:TRINITY_DN11850_c0_g1_i3.p2 TRINITY_DN11850_c0_g1~~TRINITY_DN11850_c0_g1_i3.p2  ORF type:complete len:156 (+),score=5.57 TRINITY_DN11850_c0_g1_i3:156-623(+)